MSVSEISESLRTGDFFHHIDMGLLNRRLCLTALPKPVRHNYIEKQKPGTDHMTVLSNDHLLVTMLLDVCDQIEVPTLIGALKLDKPKYMFRSTERLAPCQEVYEAKRVEHAVQMDVDFGKPVTIAYHTEHLVSSTGTMTLAGGAKDGYVESIVGLLHNKSDRFQIEPLVIGAPWFDHPRNGNASADLMWLGQEIGETLPEDIDQFSLMKNMKVAGSDEWMDVMKIISEEEVKEAFASLLSEPSKKDWGGEQNDHFSSNAFLRGRRRTAAFLFKGPSTFREMTLDMCGKRADQVHRLTSSGADISIVQHSHLIGQVVRQTLRALTVYPGGEHRKYCLIDGQATYRILKAYSFI